MSEDLSVDLIFELQNVKKINDYQNENKKVEIDNYYKELFSFKYEFQKFIEMIKYSVGLEKKVA